jgi:hypothetical protein
MVGTQFLLVSGLHKQPQVPRLLLTLFPLPGRPPSVIFLINILSHILVFAWHLPFPSSSKSHPKRKQHSKVIQHVEMGLSFPVLIGA